MSTINPKSTLVQLHVRYIFIKKLNYPNKAVEIVSIYPKTIKYTKHTNTLYLVKVPFCF